MKSRQPAGDTTLMHIVNRYPASPALGIKRVRDFKFSREHEIGHGGYALVYAQAGRGGKQIAVKVDDPEIADRGYLNYFIEREAQALFRFDHPNIVDCLAYGNTFKTAAYFGPDGSFRVEPQAFVAFEYLGKYVSVYEYLERLDKGWVPTALSIFKQVVSALEHIHGQGWVHADIKTPNIMTDGDNVKLIDFAFARPEGERLARVESDKWALGTRAYMSLARLHHLPPTKADDFYALGIVLGDMLFPENFETRYKELSHPEKNGGIGQTFQLLQRQIEDEIKGSGLPGQIVVLMRRLLGLGEEKPFNDCREILAL